MSLERILIGIYAQFGTDHTPENYATKIVSADDKARFPTSPASLLHAINKLAARGLVVTVTIRASNENQSVESQIVAAIEERFHDRQYYFCAPTLEGGPDSDITPSPSSSQNTPWASHDRSRSGNGPNSSEAVPATPKQQPFSLFSFGYHNATTPGSRALNSIKKTTSMYSFKHLRSVSKRVHNPDNEHGILFVGAYSSLSLLVK